MIREEAAHIATCAGILARVAFWLVLAELAKSYGRRAVGLRANQWAAAADSRARVAEAEAERIGDAGGRAP